jgi:pseudouridine synthase
MGDRTKETSARGKHPRGLSLRRKGRNQVSLVRAISKLGIASRAVAAVMVRDGSVSVNGRPVSNPNLWVDPQQDAITLRGRRIRPAHRVYLLLHKPAGYVTTRSDEKGRKTVYDLLPENSPWVFPVGRLDCDSSGLLLLTNDTRVADMLTSPAHGFLKIYVVELDRDLASEDRAAMEHGLKLPGGILLEPMEVRSLSPCTYKFILTEGKNRQIRKACESRNYRVRSLHRVAIGPFLLDSLPPGEVRAMTPQEIALVASTVKKIR